MTPSPRPPGGAATCLAMGAAAAGTEVVVVLGGDGTLNEAANGLAGTECALAPSPAAPPTSSPASSGCPTTPSTPPACSLESLDAGRIEPISLGVVNSRYFVFHVGIGFDAALVAQVERRAASALRRPRPR